MGKKSVWLTGASCVVAVTLVGALVSASAATRQMVRPATVFSQAAGAQGQPAAAQASSASAAAVAGAAPDISMYAGLGSWLDIFENAYRHPAATVSAMKNHGVETIYIETSNYSHPDIALPTALGALIDEAHSQGMKVEGWYLPSFLNLKKDLRKSRAALEFTSPLGDHIDSFGLDIESALVGKPSKRTNRLLELSRDIRDAAGPGYPLGAITPIPNRLAEPGTYWPHFPYKSLNHIYDVFVPMNYFSYDVSGETATRKYTAKGIRLIRKGTQDPSTPVHVIGGIASAMTSGETKGFVDGVHRGHAIGASLYNFSETGSEDWHVMEQL